jgi:hypothetical protein
MNIGENHCFTIYEHWWKPLFYYLFIYLFIAIIITYLFIAIITTFQIV